MVVKTLETREMGSAIGLPRITVDRVIFLIVLIIAAILRLGLLGWSALDIDEARQALAVWSAWQPTQELQPAGVSPAYFTFTAPLFALFGDGDAIARLAPAVFGLLTVALPWLWRTRLGTAGALAVSALCAVSPTMNLLATTAGGDAMALFAALLLFIAWMRFRDEANSRWLAIAAAALGFGLTTAPLFYTLLVTLASAWLLQRLLVPAAASDHAGDGAGISPGERRVVIGAAAIILLVAATSFLFRPAGLGDAATLFARWLGQFELLGGIQALALPVLALGRYEVVIITLGAAAIVWASWHGYALTQFLVYWFAVALLFLLLQQGVAVNVLALVLPGYLLLGLWLNHAQTYPAGEVRWALAIAIFLFGAVLYFNGVRYLRVVVASPQQIGFLFLAFVAFVAIFVAINFVRSWDSGAAYQGAIIGLLLLFVAYNWGTARWMLTEGANDPREYWIDIAGDDDLRMLVQLLEEVSWQSTASPNRLRLLSAVDSPLLRWYLRGFPNAVFGETVPPGSTHHAILTRVVGDGPAPGDDYLGTDLILRPTVAADGAGPRMTPADTLRWWIFHEHPATLSGERIILWARSDALQ